MTHNGWYEIGHQHSGCLFMFFFQCLEISKSYRRERSRQLWHNQISKTGIKSQQLNHDCYTGTCQTNKSNAWEWKHWSTQLARNCLLENWHKQPVQLRIYVLSLLCSVNRYIFSLKKPTLPHITAICHFIELCYLLFHCVTHKMERLRQQMYAFNQPLFTVMFQDEKFRFGYKWENRK